MPYTATVLRVLIASPGDLAAERELARKVVHAWNAIHSHTHKLVLLPVAWETHAAPAFGERPQQVINRQIVADSDLLVGIFWTRLGTPTGEADSGTVEEIEQYVRTQRPVMLYFSNHSVRPSQIDAAQYQALLRYKEAASARGLIQEYDSPEQFREKFERQLAQTLIDKFVSPPPSTTDSVAADVHGAELDGSELRFAGAVRDLQSTVRADAVPALDEKKHQLVALTYQLRLIFTAFPTEQSRAEEIRNVTLWPNQTPRCCAA